MDLLYHSLLDMIQGLTNVLGSSIQVPCITKGFLENWPVYRIAYILPELISAANKCKKKKDTLLHNENQKWDATHSPWNASSNITVFGKREGHSDIINNTHIHTHIQNTHTTHNTHTQNTHTKHTHKTHTHAHTQRERERERERKRKRELHWSNMRLSRIFENSGRLDLSCAKQSAMSLLNCSGQSGGIGGLSPLHTMAAIVGTEMPL